jgi:hypothetical protein
MMVNSSWDGDFLEILFGLLTENGRIFSQRTGKMTFFNLIS